MVQLIKRAFPVVTDCGGIREEGPRLGKPILVLPEKMEQFEAVKVGKVKLAWNSQTEKFAWIAELLYDKKAVQRMAQVYYPNDDGTAGLYFGPEDPDELEEVLLKYIEDPGLREKKASLAFKRARYYSWVGSASAPPSFMVEFED